MEDVIPYGASIPEQEPDTMEAPEEVQETEKQPEPKEEKPDFEKRYSELVKKLGEQGNQLGELRKQNESYAKQMADFQEQSKQKVETARNMPPPTDYEKMLREVAKRYEEGDITYEQSLLESNKITREMSKAEAEAEKAALIEQARSEVFNILSAKDNEVQAERWHEQNPDFRTLQETGELEAIKAQDPVLDDVSAYFKAQALKAKEEAAKAFELGKAEAMRIAAGSQKAGKVLADPGTSMQQQSKPKPRTEAELKQSMLAAIKE
jgi:hypothetical protein